MADGSRFRSETEQLNQSSQKWVRNRFPGRSRTLSEQDPQEERTEQELPQNENSEAENTDETNETFNINENDFCAIDSTDVEIHDAYNKEGGGGVDVHQPRRGRNHNICGNTFYANKGECVGISKVGNKYNKKSSVPFLLGLPCLLVLFVIASSFFFYISMVSKQNKK
ncbi:hypothetical protein L3X38_003600 [Prunus dulcis]|uniref:Transmembrane protein n=1 Tax=Prunus dulcis TaxID=3755 RepID=A0AAD4ZMF9_PRUDU|nr:hypothetical protein L3X38_003600 [Prunus dulcis]